MIKTSLFSLCLIIPYYLININFKAEDTSISISLSRKAVMNNFHNCFFLFNLDLFQNFC